MATPSPFMDKLASETRVHIYGLVFGSSKGMVRPISSSGIDGGPVDKRIRHLYVPTRKPKGVVPIPLSILVVNKKPYAKAMETLFDGKIVRLRLEQLCGDNGNDYHNFIRRLEIVDCLTTTRLRQYKAAHGARLLQTLFFDAIKISSALPRLRSCSLVSDCFAYAAEVQRPRTVREFVEAYQLGKLTCVDIGQYRLVTEQGTVEIKNSKVLQMWPSVASTPPDYDIRAEVRNISQERAVWQGSSGVLFSTTFYSSLMMVWTAHTSLRLWVALLEQALVLPDPLYLGQDGPEIQFRAEVYAWRSSIKADSKMRDNVHGVGRDGLIFHLLDSESNPGALEWASELLARNVETYAEPRMLLPGEKEVDCVACWPELEDGESTIAEAVRVDVYL